MISAVTGIPRPEHGFDGVIMAKRVAKMKKAKQRSWRFDKTLKKRVVLHKKGNGYPVDCKMKAKRFKRHLIEIGATMRRKYHWSTDKVLMLQIVGTGGHCIARGHGNFKQRAAMMMRRFNIRLQQQCSG